MPTNSKQGGDIRDRSMVSAKFNRPNASIPTAMLIDGDLGVGDGGDGGSLIPKTV
jgi:hypothetical protein